MLLLANPNRSQYYGPKAPVPNIRAPVSISLFVRIHSFTTTSPTASSTSCFRIIRLQTVTEHYLVCPSPT
ncbi:hypothetical protein M3J09_013805 [Ascochyta lentis]